MRTAGIICEYNPFHQGHRLQIEQTRLQLGPDGGIICLMSGNFVQRGEPAVFHKHLRARAAILGGADLVLELPVTAAVNAAGYFAEKAVSCLDALGLVELLSFGSECGELSSLKKTVALLGSAAYETALQAALKEGCSYAAARTRALSSLGGSPALLQSPNNALGVDYLLALSRQKSPMEPFTIRRDAALPSAMTIRQQMAEERWTAQVPFGFLYEGQPKHTLLQGERAMLAVLRSLPDQAFRQMAFDSEGLWSKVRKACRCQGSLEEILAACKSKRYAMSRIKRILLCLFLGLGQAEMDLELPYLRVLAFNDRGQRLLRQARKTSALPLVSGAIPKTAAARAYFTLEQRAADLYTLFAPASVREPWGAEKAARPEIIKSEMEEYP